jgi:hypothetical protein
MPFVDEVIKEGEGSFAAFQEMVWRKLVNGN